MRQKHGGKPRDIESFDPRRAGRSGLPDDTRAEVDKIRRPVDTIATDGPDRAGSAFGVPVPSRTICDLALEWPGMTKFRPTASLSEPGRASIRLSLRPSAARRELESHHADR